jgi:hypothetical protein
MNMSPFARLTKAFSKKMENYAAHEAARSSVATEVG